MPSFKKSLFTFFLACITGLGYSQDDKFEKAVSSLREIGYYPLNGDESKKSNQLFSTSKSTFWINEKIDVCNINSNTSNKPKQFDLDNLIGIKSIVIKSKDEIQPKTYSKAELFELEFVREEDATKNEKTFSQYTLNEKECIVKSPWTCWRIDNKLYFIITSATLFGQEIPKIKNKLDAELK